MVGGVKRFWKGMASKLGLGRRPEQPTKPPQSRPVPAAPPVPHAPTRGHRAGRRRLAYAPRLDGRADPGEVVWTWVKYEDDPQQGKDRPVLVVGREGSVLLGLMLSSQTERNGQPNWLSLGAGAWDRQDRPSWVRLDRVLELAEDGIRREGAVLDRTRFDAVARALRKGYGWV
jgi:PemK-like, MazF-like toxin of type II toxin-antitoxin system